MNQLDYIVVAVYLLLLIAFGYSFRKQHSQKDYFLGGRQLGWVPLTLSTMATQLSAISFISAPAFVGLKEGGGLKWLAYEFAVPVAMLLVFLFILPPIYRSGVVSIYDFLERRFDKSSRLLLSLVFQISRSFGTGIMIYAMGIILQSVLEIPFWQSLLMVGAITLVYSLQGGMKAVVYGDAAQMVLIVLGTLIAIAYGLKHLGGVAAFVEQVDAERLVAVDFTAFGFDGDAFGFLPLFFGGVVLYASYYGCDQTQAQRSLSAASLGDVKKILLANGLLRFPITLLYCLAGLVIGTLAAVTPAFMAQIPPAQPDRMIPVFIVNYLPHGVVGLLVVAILAAAMSSLSSTINSLAAVSVEDFARLTGARFSERQQLRRARVAGLIWALITLGFSLFGGQIADTVIEAINKVGSVFYGPILGIFLLAIFSRRLLPVEANVGLLAGVAANLALWLLAPMVFWFWWNVSGCAVTLAVAFALNFLRRALVPGRTPVPVLAEQAGGQEVLQWRDYIVETVLLCSYFVLIVVVSWALRFVIL